MSTDSKTISAYDAYAKEWGERKNKIDGSTIYHLYLEKPAMYGKLSNLKDKSVLCLGCGTGEENEFIHTLGVKRVVGIDISSGLIEIAKKAYPHLEFHVMDIEKLDFPGESFDYVFSSLSMHYLKDWRESLKRVHTVLKQNGVFLFSMTHPFFSATMLKDNEIEKSRILGYKDIKNTNNCEIYGDYLNPSKREVKINKDLVVTNYHRPLSTIIKEITSSGFELTDIVEPKALLPSKENFPKFWEIHQKIPEFIVFELRRK